VTTIGDGWYRLSLTASMVNGFASLTVGMADAATGNSFSATGAPAVTTNSDILYVWGAQAELGSVATSYIPTLGSTVTRAVDVVYAATSSVPVGESVGTFVWRGKPLSTAAQRSNIQISKSGAGDRILIYSNGVNVSAYAVTGSVEQLNFDTGSDATAGTTLKLAASWATNDFAISVDGAAVDTDTVCTFPAAATLNGKISFDEDTANPFWGYVYEMVYLPRTASDADLITWAGTDP
jgi:hypothetical protein